jgi:L-phenylalanine/L-methionine N-acetyltransferase
MSALVEIRPLAAGDAEAIGALAEGIEVARFGEHDANTPRAYWARWLGPPDPNAGLVLGAWRGRSLIAAARLSLAPQRRRMHGASLSLVAPGGKEPGAVHAIATALFDACDRWLGVIRCELRCRADHPDVDGIFAEVGFAREAHLVRALDIHGALADEVVLARLRGAIPVMQAMTPSSAPPNERRPRTRVKIRSVRAEDAAELGATMSEPSVVWGTLQLPHQRKDRWVERLATNDPSRIVFLVAEVDGKLAGAIVLARGDDMRRSHTAKLGMHVGSAYQGRGIGGALMEAILERAEHQLGSSRVELSVYPDNERAVKLYERSGFAVEGRCRLASLRDGAYVDDLLMARLARFP